MLLTKLLKHHPQLRKILYRLGRVLLVSGMTLVTVGLMLALSSASWEDLEKAILEISFWHQEQSDLLQIKIVNENEVWPVVEVVKNGEFKQGFEHWDYLGQVVVMEENQTSYLQLGREYGSNLIHENCLIQEVQGEQVPHHLYIEYQLHSQEDLAGFDQTALAILINDEVIHLQPNDTSNQTSERQKLIIRLPSSLANTFQLKICAGNSADRENASWTRLFQVSTFVAVLNPLQQLQLTAAGFEIKTSYSIGGQEMVSQQLDQLELQLLEEIDNHQLEIQLSKASNQQLITLPAFVYPVSPQVPEVASFCWLDEERVMVAFDNEESQCYSPITWQASYRVEGGSQEFIQANFFYPQLTLDLLQPTCSSSACRLYLQLREQVEIEHQSRLELLLKGCDPTAACSASFAAEYLADCSELLPSPTPEPLKPIMINEVMFNPLGDDRGDWYEGEWVELYNPNSQAFDLADWQIKDEAGFVIELSGNTVDTHSNPSYQPDVIIPAQGFLVAFTRGRAIFNNSGDSALLFDVTGQLVDQVQYPGSSIEDKTYGRYPDGDESWYLRLPKTPLAPNTLE